MPSLAEVVRRYGAQYLRRFGTAVPLRHRKALRAIGACRTGQLGTVVYDCSGCGRKHRIGRSCGNRHCPACQHDKTAAWLQKQLGHLLPCPYFFITFTVPAELRAFIRSHQKSAYGALFDASSQALKLLAANPKWLGTDSPGFLGVLHTWGRALPFHPHIHYIVPGGGPSPDGSRWVPSSPSFSYPTRLCRRSAAQSFATPCVPPASSTRSTPRSGRRPGSCAPKPSVTAGLH